VASILISTPAANNVAFPAVISGSYVVEGGGGGVAAEGGGVAAEGGGEAALLGVAITVTLTREDNNSSSTHNATDDGNNQWHLDKPNGLAAVKYTITATMTSPSAPPHSRYGIQN
jgi:hypothetical protein